jgi:hypothetical protein
VKQTAQKLDSCWCCEAMVWRTMRGTEGDRSSSQNLSVKHLRLKPAITLCGREHCGYGCARLQQCLCAAFSSHLCA